MADEIGYIVGLKMEDSGAFWLYGADPDCEGALGGSDDAPLLFRTRADAQKAIRISKARERLNQAQGKPVNSDFTEFAKDLRIIKCTPTPEEVRDGE